MSRQKNRLHYLSLSFTLSLLLVSFLPAAAQFCGDGICNFGEQSQCPQDCGFGGSCGDYICSPELGENGATCLQDCVCGDGICSYPEDSNRCSADCGPPITCTADTCASCSPPSYGDVDYDSIPDLLEYNLAHRFFPNIYLQTQAKDVGKSYLGNNYAIPYTVSPVRVAGPCNETLKCLEIRIGTAYLEDVGAEGHTGDSEFYAALVIRSGAWSSAQYDASQWQILRDFTAAHWGAGWGADSSRYAAYGSCSPNCRAWDNDQDACFTQGTQGAGCGWVPGMCTGGIGANYQPCSMNADEGECYFAGGSCTWRRSSCFPRTIVCDQTSPLNGPATLWASEGKHGLYHSQYECNHGGFAGYDSCLQLYPPYNMRNLKGQLLQNVGERQDYQHANFDRLIQYPDRCTLYDVWGGGLFGSPKTTDYRHHFTYYFDWYLDR